MHLKTFFNFNIQVIDLILIKLNFKIQKLFRFKKAQVKKMKGLNAWYMLEDENIVSQFDKNFLGVVSGKDVEEKIGLAHYNVSLSSY